MKGGIGCLTVLGLIFIVLKLVGTINWPWWIVLAPFWGQVLIFIGIVTIAAMADSRR